MGLKPCLICNEGVSSSGESCQGTRNISLIDKQLKGIFILKELLKLPSSSLRKWLEMCPAVNPDSWISLCVKCVEMVGEGRRIFEEIVEASRRFKVVQEQVVRKIRLSNKKSGSSCSGKKRNGKEGEADIGEVVTEYSRNFVSKHNYGCLRDPFTQGDLEAYRCLLKGKTTRDVEINVPEEPRIKLERDDALLDDQMDDTVHDDLPDFPEHDSKQTSDDNLGGPHSPMERETGTVSDIKSDPIRKSTTDTSPHIRKKSRCKPINHEGAFYLENGKVAFRCQFEGCSKVFSRHHHYKDHKRLHSTEKPYLPCDQCEKVYTSRRGLFLHKRSVHEKIPLKSAPKKLEKLKCPHCDHITDKHTLATHIKVIHKKIHSLYCEMCGKGESSRKDMKYHRTEVHGICSECNLVFPGDREGLRGHQLEAHGKEIDVLSCKECGKLFVRLQNLTAHKKLHEYKNRKKRQEEDGEVGGVGEEWICHLCGKKYGLKVKLASHVRWHRLYAIKMQGKKSGDVQMTI